MHIYLGRTATHQAKTSYGTFFLCSACVTASHAGCARPGTALTQLSILDPPRPCDCEHVAHMGRPTDGEVRS